MKEKKIDKKDFFKAIRQIAKNNLITEEELFAIITQAVEKSFHNKFDPDANIEFKIDKDKETFELINNSKVVVNEEVPSQNMAVEISLKDAKKLNPQVKEGDHISQVVDFSQYSSSISGLIRQLITQNVKEKRKQIVYDKHKGLKGEMVSAWVVSVSPNHAILSLDDKTVAFMPARYKNPKIQLAPGQRVSVYVEDVLLDSKDAQIIVSNGSKEIVRRILEQEVPEVAEGIVEIVAISRMPSFRTKVAVKSHDQHVDPVGTIIGAGGSRISTIMSKIDGEKIDVIPYSEDKNLFIGRALAPAKVISVVDKLDEEGKVVDGYKIAITPNVQQTLAIGKQGSNARLAVELTQTRIDIISFDQAHQEGVEIVWNQNITPDQLQAIENGERINTFTGANSKVNNSSAQHNAFRELDSEILSFNENLESATSTFGDDDQFDTTDLPEQNPFSKEELEKMQKEFDTDFDLLDLDGDKGK